MATDCAHTVRFRFAAQPSRPMLQTRYRGGEADARTSLLTCVHAGLRALSADLPAPPADLATNVAARAHFAAELAKHLKRIGCSSGSFAALLYPSPESARQILSFLDERVSLKMTVEESAEEIEARARRARLQALIRVQARDNDALRESIRVEERARALAAKDFEGNRATLLGLIEQARARLVDWVGEWEAVRGPLVEEILAKPNPSHVLRRDALPLQQPPPAPRAPGQEEDGFELRSEVIERLYDTIRQRRKLESELERVIADVKALQAQVSQAAERLLAVEAQCRDKLRASAHEYAGGVTLAFFGNVLDQFDAMLTLDHDAFSLGCDTRDLAKRATAVRDRVNGMDLARAKSDLASLTAASGGSGGAA
jgi:type II secretory pathway component PulM